MRTSQLPDLSLISTPQLLRELANRFDGIAVYLTTHRKGNSNYFRLFTGWRNARARGFVQNGVQNLLVTAFDDDIPDRAGYDDDDDDGWDIPDIIPDIDEDLADSDSEEDPNFMDDDPSDGA